MANSSDPSTAPSGPQFLTPPEAAARVGVSDSAVRRWLERGLIPGAHKTPGGRYIIPLAALSLMVQPAGRDLP